MNSNMMGDFEDVGDDLVDTDSFVNHRGGGEEPFYAHDENDSDSSGDDNDLALDWSHADLSAIMDELELMDGYNEDEQKDYEFLDWNVSVEGLENSEESDEDEEGAGGDQGEEHAILNTNWEEWFSSWRGIRHWRKQLADWYDYPYGRDFVEDFHCLQNSSFDVRDDLLNMLELAERSYRSRSDPDLVNSSLHHEVQEAINDILIPGMSREGLRRLHKIVLREPSLNLRKYLTNADPYVLAYVIWGLNFYLSRHAKDKWRKNLPRIVECGTQPSLANNNKEEKSGLSNMIYTLGLKLLSWFCDIIKGMNLGGGYEDFIRQISPFAEGMMNRNEVEYIR
ncbi:unnamed protein product [Nezara viridula]|uniref:Uncharacterized protein n=1 Tax=Nezara viridula TaxID=85310 RepID=A0A9P0HDT9_NEZVI|nr:unnamed protein product [Nezara viridula]